MADDQTARLGLPLLQPGQAQKEMTHNEALARIDIALQATVLAVGIDTPVDDPAVGAAWIVGTAPTGDWAGHADAVACWTADGWRFVAPVEGMTVWSAADTVVARWAGGGWSVGDVAARRVVVGGVQVVGPRQPAIAAPAGGTAADPQARAAIAAILAAMAAHGLIGNG